MTHDVFLKLLNGLNALFESTPHQIFWKFDLNLSNVCFRLSIWPNGHRESHKYECVKWIPRTNEAIELIVRPLTQLKRVLFFSVRCLVGPGSTWTSSPKMVPTPLILLGTSPPCTGWTRSKQETLWLNVTQWFHKVRSYTLVCVMRRSNGCLKARCLFGRLARVMTENVLYIRAIRIWT